MPFDGSRYTADAVVAALKDARSRVDRAWCGGKARDRGDKVCLMVAIYEASNYDAEISHKSAELVAEVVGRRYPAAVPNIIFFNDAPGRTREQVIDVLDRAADRARSIKVDP